MAILDQLQSAFEYGVHASPYVALRHRGSIPQSPRPQQHVRFRVHGDEVGVCDIVERGQCVHVRLHVLRLVAHHERAVRDAPSACAVSSVE